MDTVASSGDDSTVAAESGRARPTGPASWYGRLLAVARRWSGLLRVVGSAVLIYLVVRQTSLGEIFDQLGRTVEHWPFLIFAIVQPAVGVFLTAFRWNVLLNGIGVAPAIFGLSRAVLVGGFFNLLLPSTIGGDVARSLWIRREIGSAALSLTVVAMDRLIGLIGLCAVGLIAAALNPSLARQLPEFWVSALLIAVAAGFVTLLGHPRAAALGRNILSLPVLRGFREKAAAVYAGFISLQPAKWRLVSAFLISLTFQTTFIAQFYVLSMALGLTVTFWQLALLIPIVTLVALLPITISGIGLREVSLAVLGASFGLGTDDAVALAWLFLAFQLVYALLGGIVYMLGRPR